MMDSVEKERAYNSRNAVKEAAVLLIIGEPFSEDHKKLILAEVTNGFSCWDTELIGFDINDELAYISNRAALGEEGPNGERLIRHTSDNLAIEILINPRTCSVTNALKNFLSIPSKHKHLIYAGHAFQGSGAWVLQDDTYVFHDFARVFKDKDIDNTVRQQQGTSLYIYTGVGGDWSSSQIGKSDFAKILDVKLNPASKLEILHGILQFTAYVSNFVRVRPLNELLQSSDVVGSIRFTRPTLYIFPACQGDSALFGISGFNLLINGGYSRKACFWDFTRHLDRIDAALITHLGTDNLYGIGSVLQRKSAENVHPEIGYMYVNASDKIKALTEIQNEGSGKELSLLVNLPEEGDKLVQYAKHIGQAPQACSRTANSIEPINLYQKVGIGSLDMYILNPITDSKELKDFFHQWNQKVAQFGKNQQLSLPNTLSVCALLVWRPADPNVNIIRILFPGNAPQHKILEGLEKLKTLDILKHASCTTMSLNTKPAAKKLPVAGLLTKPMKSKTPVNTPKNEIAKNELPKREAIDPATPKTTSTPKKEKQIPLQKVKKEDVNKKTMKGPVKQKPEKVDKSKQTKPMQSNSPARGSAKSSTASSPKGKSSPAKIPEPAKAYKVSESNHTPAVVESIDNTACGHIDHGNETDMKVVDCQLEAKEIMPVASEEQESMIVVSESNVPEPNEFAPESEHIQKGGALDKEKMHALGIYDEDQDMGDDYDDNPESEEKSQQLYGGMEDSMHQDLLGDFRQQDAMQGSFHGDLMTGSIHESMFDKRHPFDDQDYMQNGDNILTPEDETSEEIQPQALPEPVAYAPDSYVQEPDVIPTTAGKEESHMILYEDFSPTTQEPDVLPVKQDLYDLDTLDITPDDHVQQFDYTSTTPVGNVQEQSFVETPNEIANVIPQEYVESKDDIQEKCFEEIEQVSAGLENVDTDMKETFLDINEPSFITSDLKLPSSNNKEYPVDVPESVVDEQDLLMHSRSDTNELIEPFQELQCRDEEESSHVQNLIERPAPEESEQKNAMDEEIFQNIIEHDELEQDRIDDDEEERTERPQCPEPAESEQKLFDAMDKERFQNINVEKNVEHLLKDDKTTDNPEQNEERIPSTELIKFAVAKEDEYVDEYDESSNGNPEQLESEINEKVNQESLANTDLLEFAGDRNDDHIYKTDDTDMIEDDSEDEIRNELLNKRNDVPVNLKEMQDSEDERAESPDSQLGTQDINRDSLEKEYFKDINLSPEPEKLKDKIEMVNDEQQQPVDDGKMFSGYPEDESDDDAENDQLEARGHRIFDHAENGSNSEELRDKIEMVDDEQHREDELYDEDAEDNLPEEKVDKNFEQTENESESQESIEREAPAASSQTDSDQHESADQSYEEKSDKSEDDNEDDESSSFEHEEATDEKCFIHDSMSEDHRGWSQKSFDMEDHAAQGYQIAEKASNILCSPELEETYPSHDEQMKYCQTGDLEICNQRNDSDQDNSDLGGPDEFNPLEDWGKPMGLPLPAPPGDKIEGTSTDVKTSPTLKLRLKMNCTNKTNGKKSDTNKPAMLTIKKSASAPKSGTHDAVSEKPKSHLSTGGPGSNLNSSKANANEKAATAKAAPKPRPVSAPTKGKDVTDSKPKQNGTKRPTTATGSVHSPIVTKIPPLPPFSPYYFDLAYIPNHGDSNYCDVEFFKRVRARYYVLSALSPSTNVLDILQEGKKTWEDKMLSTTLIPTYDNENLRLWMTLNKDKLAEEQIEIAPSASRCTIQLQDHETSSSAYRLEF